MSNYYKIGLEMEETLVLPDRARYLMDGSRNFHQGSRRFYDQGLVVGAASGTPLGGLADGIVAIVLDVVHILLIVGGALYIFRAIFG